MLHACGLWMSTPVFQCRYHTALVNGTSVSHFPGLLEVQHIADRAAGQPTTIGSLQSGSWHVRLDEVEVLPPLASPVSL